ncbi:SLC13 family permease [Deltaproteobacteria bacterium TL4]
MKKLLISIIIPLVILFLPQTWIPIVDMSLVEHRMLAIFVMAVMFWVLEPIPNFATSVLVVGAQLLLISNKGPIWFRSSENVVNFGTLIDYQTLLQTFSSPIIMLFLGGFFLAMAATKYRLDVNLASVCLKPFGTNPKFVMLGLMLITAVFSMFMSNTATTALMLAILTPVLKLFKDDDPGRIAFVLSIPFAANIGGIGTPIGTPPNAVAMKYLTGANAVSFSDWMAFGVPFALIMLLLTWQLLVLFSPPREQHIELMIKAKFDKSLKAIIVYITFGITLVLWLTENLHGMNSYVVAMIPVVIFVVTKIINKEDLKKVSWDVLWLIAGGIALGLGLENTGLSKHMIASIPFDTFSPAIIVISATILALIMSSLISHTATANLLLPLMAALGTSLSSLSTLGGGKMLVILVTLSCSFAMALPISTPPNAMAYATGLVSNKDLLKTGSLVSVIGLILSYGMAYILRQVGFF